MGSLHQCMLFNKSLIRNKKSDNFSKHFNADDHHLSDMKIIGLEKIFGNETYRLTKESLWIKKLRTQIPYGLNTKT